MPVYFETDCIVANTWKIVFFWTKALHQFICSISQYVQRLILLSATHGSQSASLELLLSSHCFTCTYCYSNGHTCDKILISGVLRMRGTLVMKNFSVYCKTMPQVQRIFEREGFGGLSHIRNLKKNTDENSF